MPVLECRDLRKSFGSLEVLKGISFTVEPGEVLAIAGPNGAGKTTLLSIVAGITDADSGEVDLHGKRLGWVPQRAATYGKLTVRENLELFAKLEKVADRAPAVDAMLERIGLADRADSRAEELSGGMRQRLSIGVGLIADPAVLLLDEPSAALDPLQRVRIWEFLDGLVENGIAVVFSTHTGQEVEGHAERVIVLDRSQIIFDGAPSKITGPERTFDRAFVEEIGRSRGEAGVEAK
jgi:ABC-2 type transport system ATP-binding protein